MTAPRAATIAVLPLVRGLPHSRNTIHRQLCIRIFSMGTGNCAKVDIYQGDTPFCHFAIEKEGNALMQDLEEEGYLVGLAEVRRAAGALLL